MKLPRKGYSHETQPSEGKERRNDDEQTRPTTDIDKTRLFKYTENFTTKNWKFSDKNSDIFFRLAEIRKIMYTPVNPSFTI